MTSYITKKTAGDTAWFEYDRFGMFIHFGLYSAGGRHEWFRTTESISDEQYHKYARFFNPDMFDPREWARKAKAAGMKYAVMTTKHHEGFCMFDSKYTDFKSTNTPAKKDFVKEFVEAFRAEGLKVGLYYSLIDWNHPHFPIDLFHPKRTDPDGEEQNKHRDISIYREYMANQITELMTNYGKIDIFWFDFTYRSLKPMDNEFNQFAIKTYKPWMPWNNAETWGAERLIKIIRSNNPDIMINGRAGIKQDFETPEQTLTGAWPTDPNTGEYLTWESCQTFSGAWGYSRDEMSWKSPEMLIRMLLRCVCNGGNLIMNVGPTGRGCFDDRADAALDVFAHWMKFNNRSVYGCTKAEPEFEAPVGTVMTQSIDGSRLYIHLLEYPFSELKMKNVAGKVDYAQFLHDASEIRFRENEDGSINFRVPGIRPNQTVSVVELFLK